MNIKIVLAAIIVLTLLVACGPAASSGQTGGEDQPPTSTPTNQDTGPGDVPTPEPTAPPVFPPDDYPTATPTPTPTPTSIPKDTTPVPPTPQPTAIPPTIDFGTSEPLPSFPEPPNGITDCYTLSLYSSTDQEFDYLPWCGKALVKDVIDHCPESGSAEELQCGQQRLAEVRMYSLREVIIPCSAIRDSDARITCSTDTHQAWHTHLNALFSIWPEILNTVDSDPQVKSILNALPDCVESKGLPRPTDLDTLVWQEQYAPGQQRAGRKEPSIAVADAIDQCAHEGGLYTAQETAWLSEITRLFNEDPERVRPLIEDGVLAALEADGTAPIPRATASRPPTSASTTVASTTPGSPSYTWTATRIPRTTRQRSATAPSPVISCRKQNSGPTTATRAPRPKYNIDGVGAFIRSMTSGSIPQAAIHALSGGAPGDKIFDLEIWPGNPDSPPSRYFLGVDYRCNDGVLKRIAYTITPYTTVIRLLGVVQNPANGFPARPLVLQRRI